MIVQNSAKCSDVISLKPATAFAALNAGVVVSFKNGPSPELILPASPDSVNPSKSSTLPSWVFFAKQIWLGYRAANGVGHSFISRSLANPHGNLMRGICRIFPSKRNPFPGRPSCLTCSLKDIKDRSSGNTKLLCCLRCGKTRSIRSAYCSFVFDGVFSALMPVRSVNRNHFCFFKKSSMARRISSATETSSFLDSSCNRSKAGSGRKKCVRFIHTLYINLKEMQMQAQQPDSFAAALYLPGLKAGVSREVNR